MNSINYRLILVLAVVSALSGCAYSMLFNDDGTRKNPFDSTRPVDMPASRDSGCPAGPPGPSGVPGETTPGATQ